MANKSNKCQRNDGYAMLMIANNGETALHGCYYLRDKADKGDKALRTGQAVSWFTSLAFKFVFLKKCHPANRAFLCSIL